MKFQQSVILIVDDNPTNLGVLFDSLDDVGYRVLINTDGKAALGVAEDVFPDLILLDIMMPGMDGFEICRRLKANDRTKNIPVIFMTALTDAYDEIKGLRLGAVDYIIKPFQVETVLARIETHLTIRKLQQRLEKQNAELDAFAHTVAHDLKNPLGTIVAYSNYLSEFSSEINQDELVQFTKGLELSAQKAVNIIRELLLLASVRKEDVVFKAIDMAIVLEQVHKRLDLMIDEYEAKIIWSDQWPTTVGYAPWVEEVWVNYIGNGLKYGGTPPRLEIGSTPQENGVVRFWVKDNGEGVSAENQKTLFSEFTRFNQIRAQGHGLGLSIVQRIMDRLGGEAGVESEPGQGSTFYFSLPGKNNVKQP